MKLTMRGKKLKFNTLMPEGSYGDAKIVSLKEGAKAQVGSEFLNTIEFGVEIQFDGRTELKEKKMIVTDRVDSELYNLSNEFAYLQDQDGSMDIMDLVGEKCKVNIIHNVSKQGNIYANVNTIESLVKNEGEKM